MKKLIVCLLLACVSALAQGPATVKATLLDDPSLPALGAQIVWSSVPGATSYSVYTRPNNGYDLCPATNGLKWAELASVSSTSYQNFPVANKFGYGGGWCYGVTATVNGVESAIVPSANPVNMGMGYYFNWFYSGSTVGCRGSSPYPVPATETLSLIRVRNGVSTALPAGLVTSNNPHRFAGHFRILPGDVINATFTLPDGKSFYFPNVFSSTVMNAKQYEVPSWGADLSVEVNRIDDSLCQLQAYSYLESAPDNK